MNDIVIDYTNIFQEIIGEENGITEEAITALNNRAKDIHKDLVARRKSGDKPFYDLPYEMEKTNKLIRAAKQIQKQFTTFVVLGIGGSALGTTALLTALGHPIHNNLTSNKRNGACRLLVADNIDPDEFSALLSSLKISDTVFNVVSKSGSTAETMSQFMIVQKLLEKKLGEKWKKHIIVTTDANSGTLRNIADKFKLKSFVVPDAIGGRFTVLTPVCLLPAAAAGLDVIGLLKGAARMDKRCSKAEIRKNPAYLFASIHYLLDTTRGKKITVMLPYSYRLKDVSDWFRQLWAESLGKKVDVDGNHVHLGQTPVNALGATDQHSQIQLYVEGPFDKLVCFLETEKFNADVTIPEGFEDHPGISYLSGHTMANLLMTEKSGTEHALVINHRPNMTIRLPEVNANSVGQLLYMLEVSTAFAGGLYRVNAFDQPGVEFGKQYAYAVMGKQGFEKKKAEFEQTKLPPRKVL
ncbi:MAG TPA: glucose-6-phosphate isomerase [Nitrospinota bacterium]|jgi:glucose-6-phosphate isomerase|nr:glucose-6-phosphate isomerase [Nitrospinota bacterium]|tara:strand:+ start:190301 stop:191701 length:1401 start_codon:yes stop_codon:yes gene_type:complete